MDPPRKRGGKTWTDCEPVGDGDEAGRAKAEGGQAPRRGGCEGRGRDESPRSEQASGGGAGGGRAGEKGRGDAGRRVGEARSPLRQAGQFQPMGEPAAQILQKSARVREEQEKRTHPEQAEHLKESSPTLRKQMEQGQRGGPRGGRDWQKPGGSGGNPGGGGVGDAGGATRRLARVGEPAVP